MIAGATIESAAVNPAVFFPVSETKISGTYPAEDVLRKNVITNMAANWPRLHKRSDWGKWKGVPLAICAGGPSLKENLHLVYEHFDHVMVCGSAHDFLIEWGIDPTYSVHCDGSGEALEFMKLRSPSTQYLMASQCDPALYHNLLRSSVSMWHCAGAVSDFQGEPAIAGGCTVGLRALNVAITLGYFDLHFFGFDSCFADVEHQHAYPYVEGDTSNRRTFMVRVGGEGGREFLTNPLFLAQAQHFQEMVAKFGFMFKPTVYGDGIIAEILKVAQREIDHE